MGTANLDPWFNPRKLFAREVQADTLKDNKSLDRQMEIRPLRPAHRTGHCRDEPDVALDCRGPVAFANQQPIDPHRFGLRRIWNNLGGGRVKL